MNHKEHVIKVATYSLVTIILAMVFMFVYAVIDPNTDDKIVFQIVGPAFQTIVGGFIGLITGIKIGSELDE